MNAKGLFVHLAALLVVVDASTAGPCEAFGSEMTAGVGWRFADCLNVWTSWNRSLTGHDRPDTSGRSRGVLFDPNFFTTVAERHRAGSFSCQVGSLRISDGAGSRTMRYLSDWIFARLLGCDWIGPRWGMIGSDSSPLYCHETAANNTNHGGTSPDDPSARCAVVKWLEFFNLEQHIAKKNMPSQPRDIDSRGVYADVQGAVTSGGVKPHPSSRTTRYHMDGITGGQSMTAGNWDAARQSIVRDVLGVFRSSYWQVHQPEISDKKPVCEFSTSRLDIALHVRRGDRYRASRQEQSAYFEMLEGFMGNVTAVASRQGWPQPMFHVFSEVKSLCPSEEDGYFPEFFRWPIEKHQIQSCLNSEISPDCPEKRLGAATCPPVQWGIFNVQGRALVLHVGTDVRNDLHCMIQADGILMGCSTFGQVAGVVSKGLKFFSVGCSGYMTEPHYKMTPAMAMAEHGKTWVPVNGSWRDPVIFSEDILAHALSQFLGTDG